MQTSCSIRNEQLADSHLNYFQQLCLLCYCCCYYYWCWCCSCSLFFLFISLHRQRQPTIERCENSSKLQPIECIRDIYRDANGAHQNSHLTNNSCFLGCVAVDATGMNGIHHSMYSTSNSHTRKPMVHLSRAHVHTSLIAHILENYYYHCVYVWILHIYYQLLLSQRTLWSGLFIFCSVFSISLRYHPHISAHRLRSCVREAIICLQTISEIAIYARSLFLPFIRITFR